MERIVGEVLRRLKTTGAWDKSAGKALVVIDDNPFLSLEENIGFIRRLHGEEGVAAVIAPVGHRDYTSLKEEGIELFEGAIKDIHIMHLVERADSVYIQGLTLSSAAKIHMLVADNAATKAVQFSLLRMKKVYAAEIDSHLDRNAIHPSYLSRIDRLKAELKALGISTQVWNRQAADGSAPACIKEAAPHEEGRKKWICAEDVRQMSSGTLELDQGTLLTPLARDYLKTKGISLVYR